MGYDEHKGLEVLQRHRFFDGDTLEIVTNRDVKEIALNGIFDENGKEIKDCKNVMQRLFIRTDIRLDKHDMLRKKTTERN